MPRNFRFANTGPKGVLSDYLRHQEQVKLEELAKTQNLINNISSAESCEYPVDQAGQLLYVENAADLPKLIDNRVGLTVVHLWQAESFLCRKLNTVLEQVAKVRPEVVFTYVDFKTILGDMDESQLPGLVLFRGSRIVRKKMGFDLGLKYDSDEFIDWMESELLGGYME